MLKILVVPLLTFIHLELLKFKKLFFMSQLRASSGPHHHSPSLVVSPSLEAYPPPFAVSYPPRSAVNLSRVAKRMSSCLQAYRGRKPAQRLFQKHLSLWTLGWRLRRPAFLQWRHGLLPAVWSSRRRDEERARSLVLLPFFARERDGRSDSAEESLLYPPAAAAVPTVLSSSKTSRRTWDDKSSTALAWPVGSCVGAGASSNVRTASAAASSFRMTAREAASWAKS